ncbi:MAG: hypothetical protein A3J62_03515 [Candidatus Buchananbacteria bacterium RIFCSPHIGHO2_02_FULL_38_8]|uniref:Type II secretion system protein GspI C-terminal domain-containing protein n=2 Tax=Candidatus Buchananiibacteriota TaxID=1817903 RepID=A0A1G1XT41_9BACT|nr:MAG: hypothetical protein A2731_03605 [Candidatus Buchananbacteria bacterium RIFCSPHIGHO2_01_FULL_39_8]OGY47232.1 MAG: hypothetical protein A3J62_03515 [Candidatus Buchananbacteria bacterium RIFCSPHIGHO2_02_FULL_38_8]
MSKPHIRNKIQLFSNRVSGFTLIEATVAVVILVVGLMAVVQFFPFALKIIADSQSLNLASNLALSKIEEVRSVPYDNIATGVIEPKQRISNDPSNYLYKYQRETTVETVDSNLEVNGVDIGLKKITVTVYWQSKIGSQEKSTQMVTLLSDY